jgi:hypothetical protein
LLQGVGFVIGDGDGQGIFQHWPTSQDPRRPLFLQRPRVCTPECGLPASFLVPAPTLRKLTETLLSADTSNVVAFKHMFHPRSCLFLTLSILAAAAVYAAAADQPPAPQDSKNAATSSGKEPAKKPAPAVSPQAAPAGGVVVFVDPATGQIRQPDASEIGALVAPAGSVAPKAPEPVMIQGPGGAVGARLGGDTLTYMVVTTAPDGKLAMDCVTGEKAAAAQVAVSPVAPSPDKRTPASPIHPQDTHDVKVPR